jgi:hypothetical protein
VFKHIHPVLRRSLFTFMIIVAASVATVVTSHMVMDDAYKDQQSERRAMRIWKNKIDGSRESNRIIGEYEHSYINLVKNNVVGEENRLSWFETIQATTNARGMPSVKYDVESQKLLESSGAYSSVGLQVYKTRMTLDIKMAHEGDLFVMLNNLEKRAKGIFSVDKCDVERTDITNQTANENKMKAYCELSWYTFKSSDQQQDI